MFYRTEATFQSRNVGRLLLLGLSLILILSVLNPAINGETQEVKGAQDLIQTANSGETSAQPAPLMLLPRPPEDTKLDVRVWTDKKIYRINENARVNFELNRAAYVYILDYTPQGGVHLIYPNKWEGNEKRSPGTHFLPSSNYIFDVSGPPGTEYLQALATTKKIDIYQFVENPDRPFQGGGFPRVPNPQNLKDEIKSGLSAKFGLHLGGEDSKIQFQLVPVEWDTDFYSFQVKSTQPANQPPQARFSYSPSNPASGDRVRFDGSGSYDPDGRITRWEWDFNNDGNIDATGRQGYNTFYGTGRTLVRLTVTDNDGSSSSTSKYVQIGPSNRGPNADFEFSPSTPRTGEFVRFDGQLSSDPDGSINSWNWDFDGDGTTDRNGRVVWKSFNSPGGKRVRLTVTDNQGASSSTSKIIQVGPSRPQFNETEAGNFSSNGSQNGQWFWHRSGGAYSRWVWYSLPHSPNKAYLNFDLLVTNQNGGSGYGSTIQFTIEDLNGNTVERGRVDLANNYRPQYSGDTDGVGYQAHGSYRISNPNELRGGFRVRVEWPPSDSRYYFATRRNALKLAYEY